MLFNSIAFAIFLPLVFIAYWFLLNKNLRLQNIFIVVVSYIFYGWWDWRFLVLIAFTSATTFLSGALIEKYRNKSNNTSKYIVISNIILNLIILCIFKYFNFFSENLSRLFEIFGFELDWITLRILLPVGISFYTFQALSYTIDVYKKKISPTHDLISFFAFVSFFPQLVAGPIERATNLLPQFYRKRTFNYDNAVSGTRQILWGLFKKIVVADNCAVIANSVFANYQGANASTLLLGASMFAFQIYGDFSGYSDIAIGTSRLFGFNLMKNFSFPYFSRSIAEFWRRWHISLTTWFRDYVYIPLGGSKGNKWSSFRNTLIVFLLSGFWHGANWTFIVWGLYHALLFTPLLLLGKNRKYTGKIVAENQILPSIKEFIQMSVTFVLVLIGWIIFRSDSILDAFSYISGLFSASLFSKPDVYNTLNFIFGCFGILIMLTFEWVHRSKEFGLDFYKTKLGKSVRIGIYLFLSLVILYYGGEGQTFIYFQF